MPIVRCQCFEHFFFLMFSCSAQGLFWQKQNVHAMADPFVSRRQVLANLIAVAEQKYKYIQDQITAAERQKRHQAHALRGDYIKSPFVVLHVMQHLGGGQAMIEFVSKLIMPS